MPTCSSYKVECPLKVKDFITENEMATYVYTVIAQPIAKNAPSFCVMVFGTDNKFDYNDVLNRYSLFIIKLSFYFIFNFFFVYYSQFY